MAYVDTCSNPDDGETAESMAISTATQTRNHVARFRSFLLSRNLYGDFEKLPPHLLNDYLKLFYENIRTESGDFYSPSSLICIRAALYRYLNSVPGNKLIDITHGVEFREANEALKKMFKKHAEFSQLSSKTARFLSISEEDMKVLRRYFNRSTPEILQYEVFFNFIFYFGIRGREHMRLLTQNVIAFGHNAKEGTYAYFDEQNISEFIKAALSPRAFNQLVESRMCSSFPKETCPVTALRLYLERLPPITRDNTLFPKPQPDGYSSTSIISQCIITNLMPFLSKEAGLSRIYTNHCIYVTSCMSKDNEQSSSGVDIMEDDSEDASQSALPKMQKFSSRSIFQEYDEPFLSKKRPFGRDSEEMVSDTTFSSYSPPNKVQIQSRSSAVSIEPYLGNDPTVEEDTQDVIDTVSSAKKQSTTIKSEPQVEREMTTDREFQIATSTGRENKGSKIILNGTFTNCTFHFH